MVVVEVVLIIVHSGNNKMNKIDGGGDCILILQK